MPTSVTALICVAITDKPDRPPRQRSVRRGNSPRPCRCPSSARRPSYDDPARGRQTTTSQSSGSIDARSICRITKRDDDRFRRKRTAEQVELRRSWLSTCQTFARSTFEFRRHSAALRSLRGVRSAVASASVRRRPPRLGRASSCASRRLDRPPGLRARARHASGGRSTKCRGLRIVGQLRVSDRATAEPETSRRRSRRTATDDPARRPSAQR